MKAYKETSKEFLEEYESITESDITLKIGKCHVIFPKIVQKFVIKSVLSWNRLGYICNQVK